MTAPTTVTMSGTYYDQDNTTATGTIVFTQTAGAFKNTVNQIVQEPVVATLASGVLSQTLVNASAGYDVQEKIDGRVTPPSYHIAGTANLDLGTV